MKKYTEEDFAKAIEDLLEALIKVDESTADALIGKHEVIEEINCYGISGPVCLGLGNYGGHAVEEGD